MKKCRVFVKWRKLTAVASLSQPTERKDLGSFRRNYRNKHLIIVRATARLRRKESRESYRNLVK